MRGGWQRLPGVCRRHSGIVARSLLAWVGTGTVARHVRGSQSGVSPDHSNGTLHAMRYFFATTIRLITLALLAFAGPAIAGDYTYAMASNDSVYAASGAGVNESAGSSASSAGGSIEGMDSRYLISDGDANSAATARSESSDAVTPPTVSGGGNSGSDRRSTHRWQSLVPGAIK